MTNRLIQQNVDIYQYPETFDDSLTSVTIGDLHGNAVKLVYFLLRQNVIKFKDNVNNPAEAYRQFVELYERSDEITRNYTETSSDITRRQTSINSFKKLIDRYQILFDKGDRTEAENSELSKLNKEDLTRHQNKAQEEKEQFEALLDIEKEKLLTIVPEFNTFIDQLEIKNKNILVRLIGDELADRGSNDYFTLCVLGLLKDNGVNVNITISNHSNEFIVAYENLFNNKGLRPANDVVDFQKKSFLGLKVLLDQKSVSETEVTKLVNAAYKPCLKIIDYTLDENGINLFTHAPVRFDLIEKIAHRMGVVYNDSSKEAMAASIDKINTKFAQAVEGNTVHMLCDANDVINIDHMTPDEIIAKPLVNIIWNRWDKEQDTEEARPASKNGFSLNYTHGHDPYQSSLQQVTNLDTSCGKESRADEQKKLTAAKQAIEANDPNKAAAQNYLDGCNKYKVLVSNETGLNQKYDPRSIDQAFQEANARPKRVRVSTGALVGIGLALGVALGLALVATGIFAPFGAGILGAVSLAATLGGGLALISGAFGFGAAKATASAPVNTVLSEHLKKDGPNMESSTAMLVEKLGPTIAPPNSGNIATISEVSSNSSATIGIEENPADGNEEQKKERPQDRSTPNI